MKSKDRLLIAISLLLLVCSSCGADSTPFLYPHTSSPYLIQPKMAKKGLEPASTQSTSINSGSTSEKQEIKPPSSEPQREAEKRPELGRSQPAPISSGIALEKKEVKPSVSEPQREKVFIDAPFDRTWQAVLKFCVLNKYRIVKESREDGTIECNIASNTAQYTTSNLPENILRFISTELKIHGVVAWDITMTIFLSPSNKKTLVEFIPRYYAISTESSHARVELKSSGYFESSCVSFISEEVKSY